MGRDNNNALAILAGSTTIGLLVSSYCLYRRTKAIKTCSDVDYLHKCHKLRRALPPPRHSHFRVVALLLLENGTEIMGANDEPSQSIAGAICAERAALLHYKMLFGTQKQQQPRITAVYIVTDHPTAPITPGSLCREYLYGHSGVDPSSTRVVLQCANETQPSVEWIMDDLYPYASPTARSGPSEIGTYGKRMQALWKERPLQMAEVGLSGNSVPWPQAERLLTEARKAAQDTETRFDAVYPIRYAAAGYDEKNDCVHSSTQKVALEYGCTQDAVCRLLAAHSTIDLLIQVDQWGIPHAPFALARSLLVEHHPKVKAIVPRDATTLCVVLPSDLTPSLPNIVATR